MIVPIPLKWIILGKKGQQELLWAIGSGRVISVFKIRDNGYCKSLGWKNLMRCRIPRWDAFGGVRHDGFYGSTTSFQGRMGIQPTLRWE